MKKLPIGIQSIREILEEDQVYVDKTKFILSLIRSGKHYFMSRPRRFGKSLFLDTLREIFKGNQKLFEGYAIHERGYNWQEYPVIYFDFSQVANRNPDEFEASLKRTLENEAQINGFSIEAPTVQEGLKALIVGLSSKYKSKVVVLTDEYDKPLVDRLYDFDVARGNRDILQSFFGTLKSLDRELRFTFTTGISKFSQVSLFSGFNNLKDLTMNPEFADMMGYTEEELRVCFTPHLQAIAKERSLLLEEQVTKKEVLEEVRKWYNSYRFSEREISVYNPFSTLNFLQDKKAEGYWYSTGTPSFLIDQLKKHSKSMVSLDGAKATKEELMDISRLDEIDLTALMYQTGYFTIKEYNPISKRYHLGLPNEEVRSAFINSLVQNFTPITNLRSSQETVKALEGHNPSLLFKQIEIGISSFAYQVFVDAKERTYQAILLSMLYGMGFDPLSERTTNTGRIDVVLEVPKTTYILELKLNDSAEKALKQIHEKKYFKPYTHKGKQIVIIGANFSSELRNVSDWKGELLSESGEKIKDILPEKGN